MNNERPSFIESSFEGTDLTFETPLRPQSLADFIGQEPVKDRLSVVIEAAKGRGEALGHCLLSGPPGLGKTTLAHILAREMGTNCIVTSGPVLERAGDLAGILTSLKEGDVLFVDEIHRLHKNIEEYLYPAMEDFTLDLVLDTGPNARTVKLSLKPFTLVGATTRSGLLSSPLRTRFSHPLRLDYYTLEVLTDVIIRTAHLLNVPLDAEGALEIAKRARGTPRVANHLLRWVRDYAQVRVKGQLTPQVVKESLELLAVDEAGLDEMDKRILKTLVEQFQGGPVGLSTLALACGEEADTLEEVHEPYLILQGFLKRTSRGRVATERAYQHLDKMAF